MTGKIRTVFRVKLRLATFPPEGMVWQRLIVDRPSAEEASAAAAARSAAGSLLRTPPATFR